MTYNLSKIMKNAWSKYRQSQKWVDKLSFAECLRRAWKDAKAEIAKAATTEKLYSRTYEACKMIFGGVVYMRRALVAEAGQMGWVLTGKTYPAKDAIKAMGFKWDCEARNWYTQDIDVAAKFAA